jgi:hypothetical protein
MVKSMEKGRKGMASCGEDIATATAMFESSHQLTKAMKSEVLAHIAEQRAAAH